MVIGEDLKQAIAEQEIESRQAQKEALEKEIIVGDEYAALKKQPAYKRLEQAILERTAALSRRLLIVDSEKELFRLQGELLGVQGVLNIVDTAIENAKQIREELEKGEKQNGTDEYDRQFAS
jgi:hypothetical protein